MTAGLRRLKPRSPRAARILAKVPAKARFKMAAFSLPEERTVPKEIQLWDRGPNPTDYGVHVWNDRSIAMVMERYLSRGNPIQIDVDHNYAGEVDGTEPQGGYAALEIRNGAPWLVFDWSAYAAEQIETGQRKFLSPEYDVDKMTGEIVALYRVSLVADPATHNARQLARVFANAQKDGQMNLAMFLGALKAANSSEDPKVAKAQMNALIAEVEKAAGGGEPDGDEPPAGEPAKADAAPDADKDTPPGEDEKKKKDEEAKAAKAKTKANTDEEAEHEKMAAAAAKRITPPGASKQVLELATAMAGELVRRDAKIAELEERGTALEATTRVAAAGERIPKDLRALALKLSADDFAEFVAGLPEAKGGPVAKRVQAAARPASGRGEYGPARPEGSLDGEDARVMARVFGLENAPAEAVTFLPDGRMRHTCLAKPKAAAAPVVASQGGAK